MRRILALACLLTLAGCLPSSCQREASRAIFPADSLSREVAAAVPMDTLRLVWRAQGPEGAQMAFPRTVQFGPDRAVQVSDVERGSLFFFDETGTFSREVAPDAFQAPYLAGLRGDTTLIFDPPARRMHFLVGDRLARGVTFDVELPETEPLLWAAGSDAALFVKVVGKEAGAFVARANDDGAIVARQTLPGPYWRHAGSLHLWQGQLLSLSGFRPVVDRLPVDLSAPPDTLALVGFDSPMLPRSRAFMEGDAAQPPLLSEAAAPLGGRLFVLNLRPGWLRVDVFGPDGRLQHRLTQARAGFNQNFYPRDLAVRRRGDGSYDLAVALTTPEPAVEVYRWRPAAAQDRGRPTADRGSGGS